MVVACGALFLASTGTGLADIAQLARNSVGTPQLRNNAVTTPKIRNNSVTTAKLRNRAVTLTKLAPNARIPGPQGPAGPQGPPGPQGPAGAPVDLADGSITSAKLAANAVTAGKVPTTTAASNVLIPTGTAGSGGVTCPNGGKIVSGGSSWIGPITAVQAAQLHIVQSYPSLPSQWGVRAYNNTGSNRTLNVWGVCINAG